MLQDVPLGQAYIRRYDIKGVGYPIFFIGFAQISRVAPEDNGGFNPPPRGLATAR